MINDDVERIREAYMRPIEDIARSIRLTRRTVTGGAIVVSLTMLSLKCDMTKLHTEVDSRMDSIEEQMKSVQDSAYHMVEPCYSEPSDNWYEVRPCGP